jgi:hypothetical protein
LAGLGGFGCGAAPAEPSPVFPPPAPPPPPAATASIAERYPGDVNINTDPDVVFVETGEEGTLAELFARWNASTTANSVALDRSTRPAASPGQQSIRLFTTAGPLGPGTIRSAGLYKYFPGGVGETVYARWYVKYNPTGTFHHSGVRLGGSNPPSPTQPYGPAGVRPNGADFFYLGAETTQGKQGPTARSTFDFYNYWMHQRGTTFFPGLYYGNSFINSPTVTIDMTSWNCIEVQLTLNEPVTGFTGEIAMWINGLLVGRVGRGTLGIWTEDNFEPRPDGTPFEGFQWRNHQALVTNYFQLLHFVDSDPTGFVNSVNYDHIVVARKYIGPIK